MQIGIIGAGWYGCHLALALSEAGYNITIFEKNDDIFTGVSGNFGIRLHKGPHYPRSDATRESCRESFKQFCDTYPDLVVEHEYAIYALGKEDALGQPSKVNVEQFRRVCHESRECQELDLTVSGYQELDLAVKLDEPSIVLGRRLREAFRKKLIEAKIPVYCNLSVRELINQDGKKALISRDGVKHVFDKIVNTTCYQELVPPALQQNFPINMEAVYQPCLALCYQDSRPMPKPISFIVMDGWFPCLMPYVDEEPFKNRYILTHGNYTIMGSYDTPQQASAVLSGLNDEFVLSKIKTNAEREMCRFWPSFNERFHYVGWKGSVLVKLKTQREFRSAVTFEHENVIYAIPGKVSNIFNAAQEAVALIDNQECIIEKGIRFMRDGVLDRARVEIAEKPAPGEPNTCTLNTYDELRRSSLTNHSLFNTAEEPSTMNRGADQRLTP